MARTSELWVCREAWRALFRQGGWEFSGGLTWLGGEAPSSITLRGRCSTSGQPFLVLGSWFATAYDEYKMPLNGVPGPVWVTVGSGPAVQPYSAQVRTEPASSFRSFCAEDTWSACTDCGQGVAPCRCCGELVCLFVPDDVARFPTGVRSGLVCPCCGQPPFDAASVPDPRMPPAPTHENGGASRLKPRPENRPAYMPAHCSSHEMAFLIEGYEVRDMPDPTLGLTDPAPMYPHTPFLHVMGAVRREHARPGVPVRYFSSFNIEHDFPDCPLCGRRVTACRSCGKWLCALEYRSEPLRPPEWVFTTCPLCVEAIF